MANDRPRRDRGSGARRAREHFTPELDDPHGVLAEHLAYRSERGGWDGDPAGFLRSKLAPIERSAREILEASNVPREAADDPRAWFWRFDQRPTVSHALAALIECAEARGALERGEEIPAFMAALEAEDHYGVAFWNHHQGPDLAEGKRIRWKMRQGASAGGAARRKKYENANEAVLARARAKLAELEQKRRRRLKQNALAKWLSENSKDPLNRKPAQLARVVSELYRERP